MPGMLWALSTSVLKKWMHWMNRNASTLPQPAGQTGAKKEQSDKTACSAAGKSFQCAYSEGPRTLDQGNRPQREVLKTSRQPQSCVLRFHFILQGHTFRQDDDKLRSLYSWRDGEAFPICVLEQCTPTDMMSFCFKKVFVPENVSKSIGGRGYKWLTKVTYVGYYLKNTVICKILLKVRLYGLKLYFQISLALKNKYADWVHPL